MYFRNLTPFKCNLLYPWRKIMRLFRIKLRKPVCIPSLKNRHTKPRQQNTISFAPKVRFARIRSAFHSLTRTREIDHVTELKSFSDMCHQRAPYSSPITPAYIRMNAAVIKKEISDQNEVEDARRSFENYLTEMIVEEGKIRDLADVEELLQSWENLRSPVFVDLVCRFYGELRKDLFSNSCEIDAETPKIPLR